MTGFGAAEGPVGNARVAIELRSVNHRFFNPSIKLPGALARWETEAREALRKSVSRGHVTLTARIERDETRQSAIDEARLGAYVARLRELKAKHGLEGDIDLATVLRLPDVIVANQEEDDGDVGQLVAIVERAAAALAASREAEGGRLAAFLKERIQLVESAVGRIAERAPERIVAQRDRMRQTVQELAGDVQLNEDRLAQEIAILADRLDVGEELDRFQSHLAAFREATAGNGSEGVGKRLGFLLQELLREANTTGSKANDATMTRDVLAIKEELERIREQVENLE
jgi:uncharacterized protein (TIGR00255 family)